jgi:hypothetical protein
MVYEIMQSLRARDIETASEAVDRLLERNWPVTEIVYIERYAKLVEECRGFWQNFENVLGSAQAGHSVPWNGREAAIVEVDDASVVLRVAGKNVRLSRNQLSEQAVRALAEGLLDMNDPRNQVQLGAFLFAMENGAAQSRRLWESASAAGQDVSLLIELLPHQAE